MEVMVGATKVPCTMAFWIMACWDHWLPIIRTWLHLSLYIAMRGGM